MTKNKFESILSENKEDKKYRIYFTDRETDVEDCAPPTNITGYNKKECRVKYHKFSKIADDRYKNIYMKRD